jgi:hypothetical protein
VTSQQRIGQICPGERRALDAEARERLAVVANAEARQAGSDPATLLVPVRLAADGLGNASCAEQVRVPSQCSRIDEPARGRVL